MSSRQLCSHGKSNELSLPERTRKSNKSSDQPEINQQTSPQPSRPGSAQLPTGDSATPATGLAARTESTAPQATGLTQTPATHTGLLSRMGSPQVPLQNTQSPSSQIPPISGPLFMEDRLTLAVSRRYVTTKLQLSSMKTHQQDHQHILYHQGLDPLQQWTIPPKEIQTNQDTHLSQD